MKDRGSSIGFVLIAMVSIQFGAAIAKRIFPVIGAEGTTALRTLIAALILLALWRPWREKISREALWAIVPYGVTLGTMNLLFYEALERIPLGIAVALEFTGPLAVALLASRRTLDFVWAILAAAGIYLILPIHQTSGGTDLLGVVYALAAGFCWGLYIILGKRAGSLAHGGSAAAIGMAIAAAVAFPFGVTSAGSKMLEGEILIFAVAVAILSSALPYSLEMMALKNLPTKTFGILMSLEPAVAALFGMLILAEHLSTTQWTAIALVVAASAGTSAFVES